MKRTAFFLGLIFLVSLSTQAMAVDLKYAGSTTIELGVMKNAVAVYEKKRGIKVGVMGGGTGAGLKGVIAGTVDFSGASRELTEEELKQGLVPYTIGWDAIAVIINKSNKVENLTMQQLKDINTGKITNWKEVGGADMPIQVVTSHAGSATKKEFQDIVMKGESYVSSVIAVGTTRLEVDSVEKNTSGIGAVSTLFADTKRIKIIKVDGEAPTADTVKANKYKIARRLNLVTKSKASGKTKEFIDFMLGDEGQGFVEKNFIGVRAK